MSFTVKDIKARIIRKLVQWRKWGGSHTENVLNGLLTHLMGDKITKQALKELEKLPYMLKYKVSRRYQIGEIIHGVINLLRLP